MPDVIGSSELPPLNQLDLSRADLSSIFSVWVPNNPTQHIRPCHQDENPEEALATFSLRGTDLLRFPDIEAAWELITGKRDTSENPLTKLSLVLRPTFKVSCTLPKKVREQDASNWIEVDNLRLMQWLCRELFNPFMPRNCQEPLPARKYFYTDTPKWR